MVQCGIARNLVHFVVILATSDPTWSVLLNDGFVKMPCICKTLHVRYPYPSLLDVDWLALAQKLDRNRLEWSGGATHTKGRRWDILLVR